MIFDNNGGGSALLPSGAAAYVFAGTATIVLNDTSAFAGLAPGKLCADFANAGTFGTLCEAGEVFTPVGTTATLAAIPAATLSAGGSVLIPISYQASGTASLGVSRTLSLSGTITPTVGAAHAFNNTGNPVFGVVFGPAVAFNPTFWVWSANAIQLWTPYVSTNGGFITRFVFQNTGAGAVLYSAVCTAEPGNVVTLGVNAAGTLAAGTTVIDANSVCSFSAGTRGSVVFTIAAPASSIKGAYNLVNPQTLSPAIIEMERPYSGPTF